MSVSSKINEMVYPLSNFESRLLCFLPICEKAFFSELTAGRIFPDLSAIIKALLIRALIKKKREKREKENSFVL